MLALFVSKKSPLSIWALSTVYLKKILSKLVLFSFTLSKNIYIKIFEFEIFFGYDNIKTKGGK
jgi:hypothetical protein